MSNKVMFLLKPNDPTIVLIPISKDVYSSQYQEDDSREEVDS